MEACRALENWFVHRVDIRVTFAALCAAILLLILSLSPSLLSSQHPSIRTGVEYNLWDESEQHLDVHLEGPERGHMVTGSALSDSVVSHIHHSHTKSNRTSIAIGLAITTRDQEFLSLENLQYRTPFLKTLLPTFCKSASAGYDYHFYVAFDLNDPHLRKEEFLMAIHQRFLSMVHEFCVTSSSFYLHFVQCNHNRSPSWAQNDAMMEAYLDGVDFYYRVNDDTQLLSPQWTEAFIEALAGFNPPNIGVVGPSHKGGNEGILTYDFVHHSHIDIFGLYYPRLFTDWWADNWMTQVYGSERTMKVPSVRVMHTLEAGTRYRVQYDVSNLLEPQIADDKATLSRYLEAKSANSTDHHQRKVISMSLWGDAPRYTFGALRNAQLVPVFFPDWQLRVYVEKPLSSGKTQHRPVPQRILDKLEQLGAEVLYVNALQSQVPPMMWRFLVADDLTLDRFIVRDADARLSDRDALIVKEWEQSGVVFHCVRDHPSHATFALLGGMWGAQPKRLKEIVHIPWQDLMMGYRQDYVMDMSYLANAIWPKVQKSAFCHDSVSCMQWPHAHPFPVSRVRAEHVGQVFDAFGNARDDDVKIIMQRPVVEECVTHKFNVSSKPPQAAFMGLMFKDDATFPPRIKPHQSEENYQVIWSVDLHGGPVRDVKSLLRPLGIKFLDQSLSSKCLFTHNCASNLRVLTKKNIMSYDAEAAKLFMTEYSDDPQMNKVTHFLCTYPVALCEYFMAFNKPLILYVTHRYEMGRYLNEDWERWNQHLAEIAQNPENTIVANNQYDAAYLHYFTGIQPKVIPSLCKYVLSHYKPQHDSVLLAPSNNPAFEEFFFSNIKKQSDVSNTSVASPPIHTIRDKYPEYTFENISAHKAVIHVPYQVSTSTLCEHYSMNIPIFVPTVELLIEWHLKFNLLSAISFEGIRSLSESPAVIPRGNIQMPDPNKIDDPGSLNAWLRLADYFVMEHIVYFSSIPDLLSKLISVDFEEISRKMETANHGKKLHVMDQWQRVFRGV